MSIVLASSSPYRQQLLERLQLSFTVDSPNINEQALAHETPHALVERLAIAKAQAVQSRWADSDIIIASDQIGLAPNGDVLSKPHTRAQAMAQLSSYKGCEVTFLTSLYVGNNRQHFVDIEHYAVGFRQLTDDEICQYIDKEQPLDCAGSFKAEGLGSALFSYQRGDDPSSLIGLPLIRLCQRLRQLGHSVL